jgi:hypothetical protein
MITTDTKIAIILRILIVTRGVEWIIELAYRGINHAMEGENGSIERLEIGLIFFGFVQRFDLQNKTESGNRSFENQMKEQSE